MKTKHVDPMVPARSKTEYFALFVFISVPLLFGIGQEIIGLDRMNDAYYFIYRSFNFDFNGDFFAGSREILYPLFIRLSWFFGLGLRNFEVMCYGIALFCLWLQIIGLTKSRIIAWGSVFPLTFICYQHQLFNYTTYDVLQFILVPFSFSSSIYLYRTKANWRCHLGRCSCRAAGIDTSRRFFIYTTPDIFFNICLFPTNEI